MAVGEISVVPVGGGSASVSAQVARCLDVLRETGLAHELTPMCTVVEGDTRAILDAAARMHESAFGDGIVRVLTTVKIDERRDKELTMRGKVEAVRRRQRD
ncbi:MAG: MTH1187 family thiamine-binding protein [Candidatus Eisenbacteria bacterium]|nr:MTH1187 family thiamine-binding protein [Candidatus Eisenbacteria bacterium]